MSRTRSRPVPVMNVTPLVDVVLVLLIIFMVVVPMMEKSPAVMLPDILALSGSNCTVDNAETDFPEPDSPTNATVSPLLTWKLTPFTASVVSPSCRNETRSSFTSSSRLTGKPSEDRMHLGCLQR